MKYGSNYRFIIIIIPNTVYLFKLPCLNRYYSMILIRLSSLFCFTHVDRRLKCHKFNFDRVNQNDIIFVVALSITKKCYFGYVIKVYVRLHKPMFSLISPIMCSFLSSIYISRLVNINLKSEQDGSVLYKLFHSVLDQIISR